MPKKKNETDKRIPIEQARNLGPISAAEMQTMNISYLDQIVAMGWEEFLTRYVELYPHRLNLNAFTAVLGAIEDQDWRSLDPELKAQAKQLLQILRSR